MSDELSAAGYGVVFVFLNGPDDAFPDLLSAQASFPIFQDTHEVEAWQQHGGNKDDIVIYKANHSLHSFFEFGATVNTNLSTEAGFANVKEAILDALEVTP